MGKSEQLLLYRLPPCPRLNFYQKGVYCEEEGFLGAKDIFSS
jgi:hypothetical protein